MHKQLDTTGMLEAVRAKIVEANPEIMEVKYGCYLSGRGLHNAFVFNRRTGQDTILVEVGGYTTAEIPADEIERYTIHGRVIRLEDVLLAAQGHIGWLEPDGMGTLWLCDQVKRWGKPMRDERIVGWNLRSDSLDQQPPETIAFLHSLLSV